MGDISTWAVVLATFIGPVAAVLVTRWGDNRRLKLARQREVFDTLMLTRRAAMSFEHVRALNRIELEFSDDRQIMTAFRAYFDNLGEDVPREPDALDRFQGRRRRLFVELVKLIADKHAFAVDRMDLLEGGYHPRGWERDEQLVRENALLMNQMLQGRRPLLVAAPPPPQMPPHQSEAGHETAARSPFPPPPEDD